jgi:hypothetical protein
MRTRTPAAISGTQRTATVLSSVLVVASALACVTALAMPDLIHGPAVMVGSMRGTALVMLVLGIPLLLVAMAYAGAGTLLGAVGWIAGLVFLTYQAWMFLFAVPFNGFFLVYVTALAAGFWAIVAMLRGLDVAGVADPPAATMPVRLLAGWMIGSSVAFYGLWLAKAVPALFASESPAFLEGTGMVTATNYVLDMAFFLPFTIIAAVALWRRTTWGVVVSGAMLVVLVLESVAIAVDQWAGSAADPASTVASAALLPLFLVVAMIGVVMVSLWYRGLERGTARGHRSRTTTSPAPGQSAG